MDDERIASLDEDVRAHYDQLSSQEDKQEFLARMNYTPSANIGRWAIQPDELETPYDRMRREDDDDDDDDETHGAQSAWLSGPSSLHDHGDSADVSSGGGSADAGSDSDAAFYLHGGDSAAASAAGGSADVSSGGDSPAADDTSDVELYGSGADASAGGGSADADSDSDAAFYLRGDDSADASS